MSLTVPHMSLTCPSLVPHLKIIFGLMSFTSSGRRVRDMGSMSLTVPHLSLTSRFFRPDVSDHRIACLNALLILLEAKLALLRRRSCAYPAEIHELILILLRSRLLRQYSVYLLILRLKQEVLGLICPIAGM